MNLCTNAYEPWNVAAALRVHLACVEVSGEQSVTRGVLSSGSYARLVIADTGVGIPPTVLERMFDPFFSTRGVGEGTGLGLSLVHGIVSDLGVRSMSIQWLARARASNLAAGHGRNRKTGRRSDSGAAAWTWRKPS